MNTRHHGQISAEMIIILAVLLGVVLLVATKMRETASAASSSVQNQSVGIFTEINRTACVGLACASDSDCCGDLTCQNGRCA